MCEHLLTTVGHRRPDLEVAYTHKCVYNQLVFYLYGCWINRFISRWYILHRSSLVKLKTDDVLITNLTAGSVTCGARGGDITQHKPLPLFYTEVLVCETRRHGVAGQRETDVKGGAQVVLDIPPCAPRCQHCRWSRRTLLAHGGFVDKHNLKYNT